MDVLKSARSGGRRPLRLAAIVLSSAAVGALAVGMNPVPSVDAQTATTTPVVATPWPGYADLIEQIMPAVVTVTTTREMPAQLMAGPEQRREFRGPEGFNFRWFQEGPGSEEFERVHGALLRRAHDAVRRPARLRSRHADGRGRLRASSSMGTA